MALSEDLPVFKACYDLLERVTAIGTDIPRHLRYVIGDKLIGIPLDMLGKIYEANMSVGDDRRRLAIITELVVLYRKEQMLLRLVYRQKAISTGRYADIIKVLDSIGRQLTGWKNKYDRA